MLWNDIAGDRRKEHNFEKGPWDQDLNGQNIHEVSWKELLRMDRVVKGLAVIHAPGITVIYWANCIMPISM